MRDSLTFLTLGPRKRNVTYRVAGHRPIHQKTTPNSHRPNACPPSELQASARGLCHLMSPWKTRRGAHAFQPPARAPWRLAVWRRPTSRPDIAVCHRLCIHPGPLAPPRFNPHAEGLFHPKPPKTRNAPTHARHSACKRPPILFSPIVTLQVSPPRPSWAALSHALERLPEPCIMRGSIADTSKGAHP
jgi:hypothetical protein